MHGDNSVIRQFIERVHGPEPHGWLVIWTRQDKATKAFPLNRGGALEAAVSYCAERAARQDVYAAVGLQGAEPGGGGRGKEDGVSRYPASGPTSTSAAKGTKRKTCRAPRPRPSLSSIPSASNPPSSCAVGSDYTSTGCSTNPSASARSPNAKR